MSTIFSNSELVELQLANFTPRRQYDFLIDRLCTAIMCKVAHSIEVRRNRLLKQSEINRSLAIQNKKSAKSNRVKLHNPTFADIAPDNFKSFFKCE